MNTGDDVPPATTLSGGGGQYPSGAAVVFFRGAGTSLQQFDVDVGRHTLTPGKSVALPSNIQYAWPGKTHRVLYVSSSDGGPGQSGDHHHLSAYRIDPASGALSPHGTPVRLRSRPIHNSVDESGRYVLVAYNAPSSVSVHSIAPDGMIGEELPQSNDLDFGIYAHQVRTTPSNESVILPTRGNNPTANAPEDPGALKAFRFRDGLLSQMGSVRPDKGFGFGPRHIDFHPTKPWIFVAIERQSQLYVYELLADGMVSSEPLFVKTTLADPTKAGISVPGAIHVHPSGRYVYVGNRGAWSSSRAPGRELFRGLPVFDGMDSNIAIFEINQRTSEPSLVENVDSKGAHPRTFAFDPSGRMLVAANLAPVAIRNSDGITIHPANLAIFKWLPNGKLQFVRKYDQDLKTPAQWWSGMVSLPVSD